MNDAAIESRAQQLGDAFDLIAAYQPDTGFFFDHRGFGVAGAGGFFTVSPAAPDDLGRTLERLRWAIRRGLPIPPVAAGGIGFSGSSNGDPSHALVVARRAVRRGTDGTWRVDAGLVGTHAR